MNQIQINLAAQSTFYKLKTSSSKDYGIFIEANAYDFIKPHINGIDAKGREKIQFRIYKDDCIKAMGNIMCSLPLFSSKNGIPKTEDNSINVYNELSSRLESYFQNNDSMLINLYFTELQGRKYLWGAEGSNAEFELRRFFVANHTTISFVEESSDYLALRFVTHVVAQHLEDFEPLSVEEIKTETIEEPLQIIYYGAPGTGKSHKIKKEIIGKPHFRTTFHPDTDYASFVGSYKPITKQVTRYDIYSKPIKDEKGQIEKEDRIIYRYVFQAFLKAYIKAWEEMTKENPDHVFLIIEEINRGNCAQIFGDIFQLLDRNDEGFSDYPIVADDDLKQELSQVLGSLDIQNADLINSLYPGQGDIVEQIKSGHILLLPNNLFIRATMNTSDQSLFPIDSAFKRRWDWRYVNIKNHSDKKYYIHFKNNKNYSWWHFLTKINAEIEGGDIQQEDKKLGYFFAKAKGGEISAETFLSKVLFFLYNDVFKDFGIDQYFFKDEADKAMTFASYFDHEGKIIESRVERVLINLGVKLISEIEEDEEDDFTEDETSNSNWDQPWFTVNEEERTNMIDTVLSVLQKYFQANPSVTTEQAIEEWNSYGLPKHALETEEVFNDRTDATKERASKIWNSPDGRKFYVSTQLRPKHMERLINKASEWGIDVKPI